MCHQENYFSFDNNKITVVATRQVEYFAFVADQVPPGIFALIISGVSMN